MKMCTLTIDYPPAKGGVARYTEEMCKFFGDDMTVLTDEEHSFMSAGWPGWIGALQLILDREDDVLMVHHVLPLGIVAFLNWRRNKVPYVVVLHGMDFELATRNTWKKFITKIILKRAHTVVTNTQYLADEVEKFVKVDPVVVHPLPGIRGEANERQESEKVNLISVGRLVERKGHQRVLRALSKMPHMHDRLRYTIHGGDGDYREALFELVKELDLNEIVRIVVDAPDEDVHRRLSKADIFVMPTITTKGDREGFGFVYAEASTFGVPSIASRIPGVDEAVLDGKTGFLVGSDEELTDAMMRLIQDRDRRVELGAAAKKRVDEHFTPDAVFSKLKKRLEEI
ncbi:MAG TPA: glycosyltransferase family 4 protein [Patescibacteria group bacterium]|nr:glycosyltransferase family 4 protein [Patescibacteria group bacterium]